MFSKHMDPAAFAGRYERLAGRSAVAERSGERSVLCLTREVTSYFCKSERNAEVTEAFNPSSYDLLKPEESMKAVLDLLAVNWEHLEAMPFHDAVAVGSMIFTGLASGFLDCTQFTSIQPTPERSDFKGIADQYFKILKSHLTEGESVDSEEALKNFLMDSLSDFNIDRDHFFNTYTFKNLDPAEVSQVRECWNSGTAIPNEILAKLNQSPSAVFVADVQGEVLEMVMRSLELSHGACILLGLSLVSGAGTDNLLSDQSTAKGRGKRAKGANSRDTASSIDENAKLMLQLRVESSEAKKLIAKLATSAPMFTRPRASAFLYQVFTASCTLLQAEDGQQGWYLPDDDMYRDSMPLTRALTMIGFPSNGYSMNTDRHLLPITTGTADLVEPRLIKVIQVEAYSGIRVELQGALRYTKRITLISEGLQRASMQGALSVIDPGLLRNAANGINAYLKAPAAYTELPRLLAGAPMRASPMTPEQLNAVASCLIAIDSWMGVTSPIAASLVFNGVTANRRVAAALRQMTRPADRKQKYFSDTPYNTLIQDATKAIFMMERDQVKQAAVEEELVASTAMRRIASTASALGIEAREPEDILRVVKMLAVMQKATASLDTLSRKRARSPDYEEDMDDLE